MIDTNDHKAFGRSIARDRLYFWGVLGIIGRQNIAFGLLFSIASGGTFIWDGWSLRGLVITLLSMLSVHF